MRVNSPLNNMIYYRFHIPFNGIYPIVKLCPVGHCSKYKAWKYLKEQYPNSFVSYAGKYVNIHNKLCVDRAIHIIPAIMILCVVIYIIKQVKYAVK